jgi:hypothetical protein
MPLVRYSYRVSNKGPLLNAAVVDLSIELGTTITAISLLSGYYLLVVGATG